MTLEEALAQVTDDESAAINTVGENKIIVGKGPDVSYSVWVTGPAVSPHDYQYENYVDLQEVKNHFIGWSFASSINADGWVVGPKNG